MEGKEQRERLWEIKYLFHLSFVVIKIIGGLSRAGEIIRIKI